MLQSRFGYLIFPAIAAVIVAAVAFSAGFVNGRNEERPVGATRLPPPAFESAVSLTGTVREVSGSQLTVETAQGLLTLTLSESVVIEAVDAAAPEELEAGQWVALEALPDWKVNAIVTAVLIYRSEILEGRSGSP